MKDTTNAQRRHHSERVKRNRAKHLLMPANPSPRAIGKHATTPASCSCHMCGNPRKYNKDLTMQERKFLDVSREYLLGAAA